jgi:hypothetical protein
MSDNNPDNSIVYVVTYHYHIDDYKRAESSSDVVSVYRDILPAYKLCIMNNLKNNDNFTLKDFCKTLYDILVKAKSIRIKTRNPDEDDVQLEADIDVISKVVQSLTDAVVVEMIYTELLTGLQQVEGEYTMLPSQTLYKVHTKTIE